MGHRQEEGAPQNTEHPWEEVASQEYGAPRDGAPQEGRTPTRGQGTRRGAVYRGRSTAPGWGTHSCGASTGATKEVACGDHIGRALSHPVTFWQSRGLICAAFGAGLRLGLLQIVGFLQNVWEGRCIDLGQRRAELSPSMAEERVCHRHGVQRLSRWLSACHPGVSWEGPWQVPVPGSHGVPDSCWREKHRQVAAEQTGIRRTWKRGWGTAGVPIGVPHSRPQSEGLDFTRCGCLVRAACIGHRQ